ncbi:MAG: protein kinase [Planctomycetes bacterium]|nr:protein kinase [Planctomycetota bacterium]
MPMTRARMVEIVAKADLLSASDLAALSAAAAADPQADADELVRQLSQQGKLTRYQAAAVYQDKIASLLFGNYVVLDRLGAGGMGQVFRARHRRMERIVALKVLPKKALSSPDAVARFLREVKAAAKLTHPNIVTAYDADEAAGVHFLVMEYVDGVDLGRLVKDKGPLPVAETLGYMAGAARGLQHAHAQGVVHRDIKPSNLLVDKQGHVKLLDMGLARLEEPGGPGSDGNTPGGSDLTSAGNVFGTADYMAPEQGLDSHHVDGRADIYGLGCTLFFLLTGRPPFGGDTLVKRVLAHRDAPIPSLRAARADVPDAVDQLFQKMIAKRPEDRPQNMAELLTLLEARPASRAPIAVPQSATSSSAAPQPVPLTPRPISAAAPASGPVIMPAKAPPSRVMLYGAMGAVGVLLVLVGVIVAMKGRSSSTDDIADRQTTTKEPVPTQEPVKPAASASVVSSPPTAAKIAGGPSTETTAGDDAPSEIASPRMTLPKPDVAKPDTTAVVEKPAPSAPPAEKPAAEPVLTAPSDGPPMAKPGAGAPREPAPTPPPPPPPRTKPSSEPPTVAQSAPPAKSDAAPAAAPDQPDRELRKPVPAESDLTKALATVKSIFKEDYGAAKTPEGKSLLAQKLLRQAQETADAPAEQYVMLCEVRDLAADTNDVAILEQVVNLLALNYRVDRLELLAEVFQKLAPKNRIPAANRVLAERAHALAGEAVEADQVDAAQTLAKAASAMAVKARDPALVKLTKARGDEITLLVRDAEAFAKAQEKLAADPDDAAACTVVGRRLCFRDHKWEEGLPLLARGDDAALKALADKALAAGDDGAARAAVGDLCWDAAERAKGKEKADYQSGARHWYEQALAKLTGLVRSRVEQRLKELPGEPVLFAGAGRTGAPDNPGMTTTPPIPPAPPAPPFPPIPGGPRGLLPPAGGVGLPGRNTMPPHQLAEYVFGLGGKLDIVTPGTQPVSVSMSSQLPAVPFAVIGLTFSNNPRIGDAELLPFQGVVSLRTLNLNGTSITDQGLAVFATHAGLQHLNLSGINRLTDAALVHMQNMVSLEVLVLNGSQITDRGIPNLQRLTKLRQLGLVGTQVTGSSLAALAGCKQLEVLQVGNSPFDNAGMAQLAKFTSLKSLDVTQTQITDSSVGVLQRLPNLATIYMRENNLTDRAVPVLRTLAHTKLLRVPKQISPAGMQELKNSLPQCKVEQF